MATTELSKYFIVVIDKPLDYTIDNKRKEGYIPFTAKDIGNIMNVMYPFYALILHDSDLTDEGIPKTEHFHICIYRGKRSRLLTVVNELHKWLGYPANCISVRIPECWNRSLRYLVHLDNPEKAPYNPMEVQTSNADIMQRAYESFTDFVSYDTIDKVVVEKVLLPDIIKALGIDVYNKYWRVVKALMDEPIHLERMRYRRDKELAKLKEQKKKLEELFKDE